MDVSDLKAADGLEDLPLAWTRLLINDHLDAQGRLLLFQTCKVFSSAVLQHEGPQLTLAKQSPAQQEQAQAIAAGAKELCIKYIGKLSPMLPCIHACVTSVELRKITLADGWAAGLRDLPNLQFLSFRNCQFPAKFPLLKPLPALRKCTVLECKPTEKLQNHLGPILANCQTLTQLVADDRGMYVLLPYMPALKALQYTPKVPANDYDMEAMLDHSTLEHVVLGKLILRADYSKRACKWTTIHLLNGVENVNLALLPLAGLELLTISGMITLYLEDNIEALHPGRGREIMRANINAPIENLLLCKKIVFKASKRSDLWTPCTPREPCFHLKEVVVRSAEEVGEPLAQTPSIFQFVAQRASGVLALSPCTLSVEILRLFGELNSSIHTLCLIGCAAQASLWAGLLAALPESIEHLVIASNLQLTADNLVTMVSGSQASVSLKRITVSEDGQGKGLVYKLCAPSQKLSAEDRQRVSDAVAQYQPHCLMQWQAEYISPRLADA